MNTKEIDSIFQNDYSCKRNIDIFIKFVEDRFNEMNKRFKNLKHTELLKSRFYKKFREEAYPIQIASKAYKSMFDFIELSTDDNTTFDAIAYRKGVKIHIEVTCVKDGQLEYYQLEHFDKYRSAPASGKNLKDNLIKSRRENLQCQIEVSSYLVNDIVDQLALEIKKNINKKIAKCYPENTVLLVAIDNVNLIKESFWNKLIESINIKNNNFLEIYLISFTKKRAFKIK